jgi:BlaI family transcriptional regulator, penicillinase repressor
VQNTPGNHSSEQPTAILLLTSVTYVAHTVLHKSHVYRLPMKNSIRISDAEWEVMAVVWEKAPVAASEVANALEKKKRWTLTTVRTLLRRLVNKQALKQELEGKRFLYTPVVSAEECARWESNSFVDRVLGWVPSETILHLVQKAELSNDDIQELRRILRQKEK